MLKCRDCRCEFEEPHRVQEDRGEFWGVPAFETMYYCPFCGSEDFGELDEILMEEEEE